MSNLWVDSPLQISRWAVLQTVQPFVDDSNLTAEKLSFIWIVDLLQLLHDLLPQNYELFSHRLDISLHSLCGNIKHKLTFDFDPTCLSNMNLFPSLFICVILPPTLWSSDHSHASRFLRDKCEHAGSVSPLRSRASVWARADPTSWRTHAASSSPARSCWLLQQSS